tara:strand:+ start:104 stop:274 length:171 start_codon:yes stop_codon:yes gene_type:complete
LLVAVQVELTEQVVAVQVDTELFLVNLFADQLLTLLQSVQVELVELETVRLEVIQV